MDDESGGHNKLESILHNQRFNLQSLSLKNLREITNDFSDERLLGQGGFGRVYKGVLENGNTIAVKKLTWTMSGLQDKQYENEARHLMRLKHPNIVQLVGCCSETEKELVMHNGKYVDVEKPERLLCLEYLPNGSLCKYLSDASSGLDWDTRYKIIIGICYGLHYLHEEWQAGTPIIHRDLKPANILLDDNMVPKIADFGLSRLFGELQTRTITENQHGTLGYMSPEYLHGGIITKKLDIFSLGVIIIEIITGDKHYPYNVETSSEEFIELVLTNWKNRLKKVQGYTSRKFYCQQIRRCIEIGLLCVKLDRAKRPTTQQIIEMFSWDGAECSNKREVIKVTKKRSLTEGIRVQHYPPSRRLRVKEHDRKWWERPWPEDKIRSVSQMSRATFDAICEELGAVAKEETVQYARIQEEVAKAFTSFLSRAPSLCRTLVDQNQPPRYKLIFTNGLGSEVFTKKVICDTNGEPLKICVIAKGQDETDPRILSAKIRVVVLNGNFNRHNQECWTWEEFNNFTVHPREKGGAVLTGDLELSLTNGEAYLHSATFIFSSMFVRSGKFRLGVMIIDNLGERVQEGVTEPFTVKERRGEGYKKHDIPSLNDDVWRLKKISKDGAFYDALRSSGILVVKDFLRLYYKDEQALRNILIKATELAWTTIVEHAKKCDPGRELYSFLAEGKSVLLFFNSVYQIVGAKFGDNYLPFNDLEKAPKELVIQWSKVAYETITCKEQDYEMDDDGKPRLINQGMSMLEHKFTDLMQDRHVCQANNQEGTSYSDSKQCTFKRLGSIRLTQNDEDESIDFSVYMDSISEHCPTTYANDITGLVTLRCPAAEANEATGSVVLTQASLTVDDEVYNIPLTENVSQLCEEQQPAEGAQFAASLCAVRALADYPMYSRHGSFKEPGCHDVAELGAEPAV